MDENTTTPEKKPGIGSLVLGFAIMGGLIGYIVGITDSEIAKAVITALFAFVGGKIFTDLKNKEVRYLRQAGDMLIGFSLLFFIGLNGGIFVKVNDVFVTPATRQRVDSTGGLDHTTLLRNALLKLDSDLERKQDH